MLPKEYLDSWNELCAECKMVEADLANPSEIWLTKVLISYLRMFGYRVEIPNFEEGTRDKRRYLIKLVRHIDHIYKITDKTFTFTYYDLLRPSPKKTSHMLRILLNYLYYFNMFKTNVFKMATERLKERQNVVDEIKYTIEENKTRHTKAEKLEKEMASLSKQIPLLINELKSLNSQIKQSKAHSQQKQDAVKDLKSKIDELKGQLRNLRRLIVPEDEGQELQTQLAKIQENISDCEQQTHNAESNLKAHIVDNSGLQDLLKIVELSKEVLSSEFVDSFNEVIKQIMSTEVKIASFEKEKNQLVQMIIGHQKAMESLQQGVKLGQAQYNEEKQKQCQTIICKTKECEILGKQAGTLRDEVVEAESSINDQQRFHSYIQKNVSTLMNSYK
ncbi:kinectin [Anastrepha obliqua]|uniref:kinectin n=1 Tax=Anastrepha obliqua TaxID=95512 RepID=UPI0024093748|nr:kinectin [Anastrepha obliqua]